MIEGIYEEIISRGLKEKIDLLDEDNYLLGKEKLDVEEGKKFLSAYIGSITRKALEYIRDEYSEDSEALFNQIKICNEVIELLKERLEDSDFDLLEIEQEGEILTHIYSKMNNIVSIDSSKITRPITPISESSLFTGSHHEPNMLGELKREIATSDSIDMLVSFIKWSGLRCIYEELKDFTENKGGQLRVITTSYMEATDYKAIEELGRLPNTEIKVSYDTTRTRLHAKSYVFKRDTGFSTAYIGSSNLSNPALTSGLEWNIKVTEKDSLDIIKKVDATFESYWNDNEFTSFDLSIDENKDRLKKALTKNKPSDSNNIFTFDIYPYHFQKEILEKLEIERKVFGRYKNLLVAATGVGKTVISAFDYKRFLRESGRPARLLYVVHREEILKQSLNTFRGILKDNNFGDLLVGEYNPASLDHLFISIQSFNSTKLNNKTSPDFYDYIIVDEFHHAAADSYQVLLEYYKPKILLGLTATPERMDGRDILGYFDGEIAAEMRLTEAIDKNLLSPFQYFCVSDAIDLSTLKWSRGGYSVNELENLYTTNDLRSNQIINSINKYLTDIDSVKGLGFCVSIEHAKYMANFFNENGIASEALYAGINDRIRNEAKSKLVYGELKFIFVVDLYNEGIDIPEINTVLFLRPTESLTVFIQQLGRGLRLSEGKECLTVLDYVGQAHKNYNFEDKFKAITGKTKHSIRHYVENGFFNLPKGCFVQLEKQAKEYILRNIKDSANNKVNLINKMKHFLADTGKPLNISNLLEYYNLSLFDFYGRSGDRSFYRMMVEAGVREDSNYDDRFIRKLPNLLHVNSEKFITFVLSYLDQKVMTTDIDNKLMRNMLYYTFYEKHPMKEGFNSIEEGINNIFKYEDLKKEVIEILEYNYKHMELLSLDNTLSKDNPLQVHCSYNTKQIMAAFEYYNEERTPAFREGVKYFDDKKLDIFFITLNKSEKDYSPSTLYKDYAINESLFHWESQSKTSQASSTGQRYINHRKTGNKIALFVREYKKTNGYTSPYIFLGECEYISHKGDKPISFVWKLKEEIPPNLIVAANKSIL